MGKVWVNIAAFTFIHIGAAYGIYLIPKAFLATNLFAILLHVLGGLGITAGYHRLWSHRSYKAKLPTRIFLAGCATIAAQDSIHQWARDHRVHHKYSETNADPHNAQRGFFFSHMGWLLEKKHQDVIEKGKLLDLSDLINDPVVSFQKRFYKTLSIICNYILPTVIPYVFWNESMWNSYFICGLFRYIVTLHNTWAVNSFAHLFGYKPYDKSINPAENIMVSFGALGEGWHNYHHTFPFDYSAGELAYRVNFTTMFLDFMALFGQVYDRKRASPTMIQNRIARTGSG